MGLQIALRHRSVYRYSAPTSLGPHVLRLRPCLHVKTPVLSYALQVSPLNHLLKWQLDPHMNQCATVLFPSPATELAVEVALVVDLSPINPFDFLLDVGFDRYPFTYAQAMQHDLQPWLQVTEPGPELRSFLGGLGSGNTDTVALLLGVTRKVRDTIRYTTRLEEGVQRCAETLSGRIGSCRDTAWLLVQLLRELGIAARFVSGYLIQLADETGETGRTEDSAELHAWVEAYVPGAGWIGLDPTSGALAAEGHLPLYCTPDARQAAPIVGTVAPVDTEFTYSFQLQRVNQQRSLARPFSDEEWQAIRRVAHQIDTMLEDHDVRLTMGGEPTYVSVDHPERPEWNLEAIGEEKRTRGMALLQGLHQHLGEGALLHFGQGKWYPGEPLPRWILSCYWRTDKVPVWQDASLIADEHTHYGLTNSDALRLIEALSQRLQVSAENILPAYEPPADEPLLPPAGTGRGATSSGSRIVVETVRQPTGYLLPLRRREFGGAIRWSSQLWFARQRLLELSPGDSPIGYRIPLEAMPWVAPDELHYAMDEAPFADKVRLPETPLHRPELFQQVPERDPLPAVAADPATAPVLVRSALCVQVRQGRMHVFLPFIAVLADYLDLISAVEDTCRHLQVPVWLEGYAPVPDPRMQCFSVTPDPGVLEINLPPARNWDELERTCTLLDAEASRARLTTSKYAWDGAHRTTGGGSHIVLGGPSVPESPLLRRPDLLRSMLIFWQNHPSLSYLFSGLYVGPTSQYPRVDEARMDALYELEVAMRNLPPADACPPETIDGLFRNLLADMTGNTHRAEFCVDKLYPPPGYGLQLGLLELRAFEMPPHLHMNLLQMLLIRAVVCMFWKQPYDGELVRWGTALHDRYMLPHVVQRDFDEVLAALQRAGVGLQRGWFMPHWEFRFPRIGAVSVEGVELELRQALEPWNVLAEESVSGRTVRSVDSSLERLQVTLRGFAELSRYMVTCNGRHVPLQLLQEPATAAAGVRYRARQLSATLHPTVPVHAPLVFDLIDRWDSCSIARCVYHVQAPEGRFYTGLPADAAAAEERRNERFVVQHTTRVAITLPAEEINPIFPGTLDLRMPPPAQKLAVEP
ncbi:MAG: transglutaminase family protein [Acidobacteriota bacterium]|nr:transglutaminase family protein [Acidobacteriota bacterium]